MLPEFKTNLLDASCVVGEDLSLSTSLDGIPIPKVKIMRNGEEMKMSKQKEILEFVQDVVVLKFQKVHTEDAGEYCLVASNDVGSDTCKVLIDVIGKKMSNAFVTHDSHPEYLTMEMGRDHTESHWCCAHSDFRI